jgi:hypothetical protein
MKRHAIAAEEASIADAEHGRPERSAIFRQGGMLLTKDPPAMRPVSKRGILMTGRRQESTARAMNETYERGHDCDEQVVYHNRCDPTIRNLTGDLEKWRYKRGLVVYFQGRNWWGLGHTIPATIDIHRVCRVLRRFCYISMYEMRLGKLFGYGNGLSWHPERSELEQYGSNVTVRYFPLYKEFLDKAQELDNHSLIIVHSYKPVDAATNLRTWKYSDLPLPPERSATQIADLWKAGVLWKNRRTLPPAGMTRCFARFVTYERFQCARATAPTVYHLRTGFADVVDTELRKRAPVRNFTAIGQWLNLSCPSLHLEPKVHVISDSPGVVAFYKSLWGTELTAEERRASNSPTRSWSSKGAPTSLETQTEIAQDICVASSAEEIYYDTVSSFMQPLVARSMCIRRVLGFDYGKRDFSRLPSTLSASRCQPWFAIFSRNMYSDSTFPSRYKALQENISPVHPCYRVDSQVCRQRFLDATA